MARSIIDMSLDEFRQHLKKLSTEARTVTAFVSNPKKNQPVSDKLPDGVEVDVTGRLRRTPSHRY
jgi:hypothetical protein